MKTRSIRLWLVVVIGLSVSFGMLVGGLIQAPKAEIGLPTAIQPAVRLVPALASNSGIRDFADVVEKSMDSVVSITARDNGDSSAGDNGAQDPQDLFRFFFGDPEDERQQRETPQRQRPRIGEGTGFVIASDGYILTNYHVVQNADQVKVGFTDGSEAPARIVGTDPSIDLALLKVEVSGLHPLPLGDSSSLRVGEWVIAIGNPLNFEQTVTVGVLSARNRRVPLPTLDTGGLVTFLQTDAAINFGNSGGPLLDIDGNVIGINTAIARQNLAEGIGFALPINHARRVIDQLRDFGEVRRGYIGIRMSVGGIDRDAQDYFGLPDRNGVIVESVNADSPAERAGLRKDDVIREVDGERVHDNDELIARISAYMPGERVEMKVFRKGRTLRLNATLAERPIETAAQPPAPADEPEPPEPEESEGLGLTVRSIDDLLRQRMRLIDTDRGVVVTEVAFDSLAAEKGIGAGLIVTHVNDSPVESVAEWDAAIGELRSGQPIKLDALYVRDGRRSLTFFLRAP